MDLAQMKAAATMEGVLSGAAVLELIAEVERGKTEIVRMAKEWLQEPGPDNGTVGELDVDEITVMIAGLVDKVESLTALCDGYRGEVEGLKQWDSLVCSRCHGIGETTAISGQTPESYSQENIPCPDCVGPIIDERDAALSALTRARAEGMEEAAKVVDAECARVLACQTGKQDLMNLAVDQNIRMCAVLLPDIAAAIRERATKGDSDEG